MKTGGTLNFLKRAGAIFMLLAVFATSCNKYADDFDQINTKLDALAVSVQGVTQLTTDMAALKTQVAAIQTAIATLPTKAQMDAGFAGVNTSLTAITSKITSIETTLGQVATTGNTTKGIVEQLTKDLTALSTKVAADNKTLIDAANSQLLKLDALSLKVSGMDTKIDDLGKALKDLGVTVAAIDKAVKEVQAGVTANAAAIAANGQAIAANGTAIAANGKTINENAAAIAANGKAIADLAAQLTSQAAAVQSVSEQITALAQQASAADAIAVTTAAENAAAAALASADILNKIADVQSALALVALTGTDADATAATIKGLQAMLTAQQATLDQLLANSNMYTGAVNITTDNEVDFWLQKIAIWPSGGMINGNFNVDGTNITTPGKMADLKKITDNIIAVIGAGSTTTITSVEGQALTFALLASTTGSLTVSSEDANGVSFPKLDLVGGAYKVSGNDIDDAALRTVKGNFTYDYQGAYSTTALEKVEGDLRLARTTKSSTNPGTSAISMAGVAVTGNVYDVVSGGTAGELYYPNAVTIDLAGGVKSMTASVATDITIGSATSAGLVLTAPKATNIDLSKCTKSTGDISINTAVASTVNLSQLATFTKTLTVSMKDGSTMKDGTVNLDKLTGGTSSVTTTQVIIEGPKTISLLKYEFGTVSSTAETVVLPAFNGINTLTLSAVKHLTLGALYAPINLGQYTTLVQADITGKSVSTVPMPTGAMAAVSATSSNSALTTLNVNGVVEYLNIGGTASLTSLTTGGVVNSFTLDDSDALVSASLGHSYYVGSPGATFVVTGNLKLAGLTSTTDMVKTLTVSNNDALTTANFSSMKTKLVSGAPDITIGTNSFTGTYVNAIGTTSTTVYQEATITSDVLSSLKPLLVQYKAATVGTLNIDLDLVKYSTGALDATTLATKMTNDTDAKAAWLASGPTTYAGNNGAGAINNWREVIIIQ